MPNKADAPNPAMTAPFQIGRRVGPVIHEAGPISPTINKVPPKVLNAALYAIYHATVFSRNYVRTKHGAEGVYQIMDAVHEVRQILLHWGTSDNN
jgi:hypothetical protein